MATTDLLIELGTEELPPKALKTLSDAFAKDIIDNINGAGLKFESSQAFASPRRLAILVNGIEIEQADKAVERRGPAIQAAYDKDGNPTKAAEGFARSCKVTVDQLEKLETDKGTWLTYTLTESGKKTADLIPGFIEQSVQRLPIPKRMRWGSRKVQFVRPAHWLVCLLGDTVIDCTILDQKSGNQTFGHRFHANQAITINNASDYENLLKEQGKVIANYADRQAIIKQQVVDTAAKKNATAVIDQDLLDEVTGLVEWPVALLGNFETSFLEVPQEALIYAMKDHQKYFPLVDNDGKLQPYFITICNIESTDPAQVISGNEKVIRPRLADAAFFFETDKKKTLSEHSLALKKVVFQAKLGTVHEKCERIASLASTIATQINGDAQKTVQAGLLCKADLTTDMVSEFANLQGIMATYYAQHENLDAEVCLSLSEHYLPRYSGDQLPETITGTALAIADKLDTLVGIFGINQKPSGDKDPFALRRATLGILRIIIEKQLPLDLVELISETANAYGDKLTNDNTKSDVFEFVLSRYRAWYQDQSIPTGIINAVQDRKPSKPLDFDLRIKAVHAFSERPEAESLAAANKRVSNILNKQESAVSADINAGLLTEKAEIALSDLVLAKTKLLAPLFEQGDYDQALSQLAELKEPVDAFFDDVMVNVEDEAVKNNRLALLTALRQLFLQVADISLL